MTDHVPSAEVLIVLALAAWRTYHLIAEDTILDRPRAWAFGITGWEPGDDRPDGYREKLALFITCPYCAGFWISVGWWLAWAVTPWSLVVAVPLAVNTLLVAVEKCLSIGEE